MKLIHSLVVTPRQCGLYETACDLIRAEEKLGHLPIVIEPAAHSLGMTDPRVGVATTDMRAELLATADVIIDHSGVDGEMLNSGVPIIHIRHGRPLSTFLMSQKEGCPDVWSHVARIGTDPRYAAIATFWPEHAPYWEALTGRECHVLPAPVDLEHFTPEGPKHEFEPSGEFNVVIADMWREDACPFECIQWFRERQEPGKRLHLYGIKHESPPLTTLLDTLGDGVGECRWADDMAPIYRAADAVYTSSTIATRVVREALACGAKVQWWHDYVTAADARQDAEREHNPKDAAQGLVELAESVLGASVGS